MRTAIGIDLGGSHVTAAVITDDGAIHSQHERDLSDLTFERVVAVVIEVATAAKNAAPGKVDAVGIGSPGNVDLHDGSVRYSPNFGWIGVPLGKRLREGLGTQVFVGNDARCATLGEYHFGTGKGANDFVMLTLGTGIGGGIVADGELILGHGFAAGEIGHHQIRPETGFICGCGKIGCMEAQASGTGLIRHAMAVAPSFPRSFLLDPDKGKLGSKKIRKAAQAGDLHAIAAWKNYTSDLALGLANVIAFTNPELIALGGGVASAGDFMLDAVRERVDELTTMAPKGTTRIEIARLGNDAGQVGAAMMAFQGGLDKHG